MKKTLTILIALLLLIGEQSWAEDKDFTLTVVIKNFKNTDGNARVAFFDSEENFLKNGEGRVVEIEDKSEVKVIFDNVNEGTYAVSIIHDENGNGDLDTAVFGIPTEDYGFSNDAKGMFGPPSFEDCKFDFTEDKTIVININ